jgi:hypothetical protein
MTTMRLAVHLASHTGYNRSSLINHGAAAFGRAFRNDPSL